jgi:DNA-binding CsgD family transcriptional regulator
MKDQIIELRKLGNSYNEIVSKLGCTKSNVSYHCGKLGINLHNDNPKKISEQIVESIRNDKISLSSKEIALKYNVSVSTVNKFTKMKSRSLDIKPESSVCLNCGKETPYRKEKRFCSNQCGAQYIHKLAYKDFLENNEKYCVGNYTAKNFKDFIVAEQNDKCLICGMSAIWENKILVFVLDHIDGNASNNKRENLRLICPNCDSQTSTFKSKTKVSMRRNYNK